MHATWHYFARADFDPERGNWLALIEARERGVPRRLLQGRWWASKRAALDEARAYLGLSTVRAKEVAA